ncbi:MULTISPECIES: ATP synthase F1 subunit gamma [Arcobacteraceae]|uniref:ATP synthase gamma chain n=1 Tax=Poseidonibacter parvus TaxID=1850254 RepID=A0A1P8KP21_9BACT|nr:MULTISPECIES: ATP synthase F1 subunit gamma [Arcobacteraceae]APW66251.1 F0F1 ATP synthase subunit gamma [Poseidonibacter parvus]
MANLKEIKLQIGSVKNTQKTTKAMKLVSSAKLTRTRQLSDQAKSYAGKINDVLSDIATRVSKVQDDGNIGKAFIANDNPKTVDIVFVTADKGLCGGFNMATIKTVSKMMDEYSAKGTTVRLRAAGRKGVDYFNFQGVDLHQSVSDLSSAPEYDRAADFINDVVEDFNNGTTDKVVVVYNGFLNMLTQEIRVRELLPISLENADLSEASSMLNIEPDDDEEVLNELTGKYIDFNMYYALIDSLAAEHSARMQAMEAATKNAKEKVDSLTVEYNKARQAAITTELIEIISGVESLK